MTFETTEAHKQAFREDGVVKLASLLSPSDLAAARHCYEWSVGHPGPHGGGHRFVASAGAETFEDKANPDAPAVYESWLRSTALTAVALALWDDSKVRGQSQERGRGSDASARSAWFMYEQVFMKRGESRRTCWHQDSSYLAVDGDHLIVFWICFDAVPESESLEFVRGSHAGVLYNGSTFSEDDPTEPLYRTGNLPRLPNVDARPDDFDIIRFAVEPGDVVAFHPKMLHGGAATHAGGCRETLSVRLFGDDAVYSARPGPCGPRIAGLHEALEPGDPFRYPTFLHLA